ncbi:hypothetical protein JCM15519_33680 [Fundidesulfovibrio butyratiphilus]
MSTNDISGFVDVVLSYYSGSIPDSVDVRQLKNVADLVASDLSADHLKRLHGSPHDYREEITAIVQRRWFQTAFRKKALEVLGASGTVGGKGPLRLFFSYRRSESVDLTRHLAHTMGHLFKFEVFFDQSALTAGPFPEQLKNSVRACDVFLLMICPNTFDRIMDINDWVRQEIECAISQSRMIVPVLVNNASLPEVRALPENIRQLLDFNAFNFYANQFDACTIMLHQFIARALAAR